MTYDYDIEMDAKNHIIAHIDGKRCLIDTGSPLTFSDEPVTFGGQKAKKGVFGQMTPLLAETGWNLDNIRELSGLDIDALVGTDLLATNRWWVDPFQKTLTVGFLPKGKVAPIVSRYLGSSPVVEAEIAGEQMEMLLDTGANVHFVSRSLSGDWPMDGIHEDFYPQIGKFTTPMHLAEVKMFGHNFGKMKCADLPDVLDMAVQVQSMFGGPRMQGIAGMEILNHGGLGFDLRSGVVVFTPKEA